MKNALTYITRRCPRNCSYCLIRDGKDVGPELSTEQWQRAFEILKELGVTFNLILGNEPWLLGNKLYDIMKTNEVPYAMYTTCSEPYFSKFRDLYFKEGVIDNLSCGIDYPPREDLRIPDDSFSKSIDAFKGLKWAEKHYPNMDRQGTITIHKKNLQYVPELVKELKDIKAFIGTMFLHWDIDGKYDFFPPKEEMADIMFTKDDYPQIKDVMQELLEDPIYFHHPEYMSLEPEVLANMGWHCKGDPIGGPTVDQDGSLRVCGYRRGTHTPKFSIFDLPEREDDWREAVYKDAKECPGCAWSFPWEFRYWSETDPELGRNVYVKHAGTFIPDEILPDRKIKK